MYKARLKTSRARGPVPYSNFPYNATLARLAASLFPPQLPAPSLYHSKYYYPNRINLTHKFNLTWLS